MLVLTFGAENFLDLEHLAVSLSLDSKIGPCILHNMLLTVLQDHCNPLYVHALKGLLNTWYLLIYYAADH